SSLGFGGGHAGGAGYGGGGGGGLFGGIGLFDILIIALIGYVIYRIVKSRRQQNAYSNNYGGGDYSNGQYQIEQPPVEPYYRSELQEGLDNIRQYDRSFDENRFTDIVSDVFFKVQSAWSRRDLTPVKNLMAQDIFGDLSADISNLKAEGHINKLESIGVREVRISEAWQETGKDFITVEIAASMIDYTTDEAGRVVDGDNNTPVGFMEYWTFVRDIGSSNWQLTSIQQPR
ncbi:MAG: Tim44 domain-containing protein, partial [Nitrospirae bacterium]|nr:Tim44 domain-containing protein [Nitrospirota bacterium]